MPTGTQDSSADRRWLAAVAALVFLITAVVFIGAIRGEFLSWDDDINITGNPHVRGLTAENLQWMFSDTAYVRRYMPLGWLSWAAQYQFFGENSAAYHFGNIVLHALSSVLLLLVLKRLLWQALPEAACAGRERVVLICAGLAAMLWAIHPLRVEVVAWASGRLYCQALLLLLGSLLAYLRYVESRASGKPSRTWFWSSVAAYGASLLTYPLGLGFIVLLPLLDLFPLRRFELSFAGLRSAGARQALVEKIPFAVVVGMVFALTLWARSGASGLWRPPPTLAEFGALDRVMQGFYVWATYLWRTLVPRDLSPVYTSLLQFDPLSGPFVCSVLAIVGLTALVIWQRRRFPGAVVAWACYLIVLVPMLGFTEHPHYANDRYSYLPSIALAAVVAGLLFYAWQRRATRLPALVGTAAIAIVCSVLSVAQTKAWRDTDALFNHIIVKMGDSPFRADTYCRLGNRRLHQQRFAEAERCFADAVRVAPAFLPAHSGLGDALERQGRGREAVDVYVNALKTRPGVPELHLRAADTLAALGRHEEATRHYRAALQSKPGYGQAMNGLAWLLATCPDEKIRNGEQAVTLAESIAGTTGHQVAVVEASLAAAYAETGAFRQAVAAAERAAGLSTPSGDAKLIVRCARLLETLRAGKPYREAAPEATGN